MANSAHQPPESRPSYSHGSWALGTFSEDDQTQHAVTEINPAITTLELASQLEQRRCLLCCGVSRRQKVFLLQNLNHT